MASKGQKFNKYTVEFRQMVVQRYLNNDGTPTTLGREYGISHKTIETWIRAYKRTYYKYRNTQDKDYYDYLLIREIFEESKRTYGYRRILANVLIDFVKNGGSLKDLTPKNVFGRKGNE